MPALTSIELSLSSLLFYQIIGCARGDASSSVLARLKHDHIMSSARSKLLYTGDENSRKSKHDGTLL